MGGIGVLGDFGTVSISEGKEETPKAPVNKPQLSYSEVCLTNHKSALKCISNHLSFLQKFN